MDSPGGESEGKINNFVTCRITYPPIFSSFGLVWKLGKSTRLDILFRLLFLNLKGILLALDGDWVWTKRKRFLCCQAVGSGNRFSSCDLFILSSPKYHVSIEFEENPCYT